MEKLLGKTVIVLMLICIVPTLGALCGAFSGWTVSLFFNEPIMAFFGSIGVTTTNLALWQVGAAMGFLGGFLKTSVHQSSK